ncbi:two-component system response regulator [Elusimicrobiota bacterium]
MVIFKKKKSVLIIDDEQNILQICSILFSKWGFEAKTADSGAMGVTIAKDSKFDIILLDVTMPEEDGFEVCLRLRNLPATKNVPVIFLTGLSNPKVVDKAYEYGATGFVVKPIDSLKLKSKVEEILAISIQEKEQ